MKIPYDTQAMIDDYQAYEAVLGDFIEEGRDDEALRVDLVHGRELAERVLCQHLGQRRLCVLGEIALLFEPLDHNSWPEVTRGWTFVQDTFSPKIISIECLVTEYEIITELYKRNGVISLYAPTIIMNHVVITYMELSRRNVGLSKILIRCTEVIGLDPRKRPGWMTRSVIDHSI